MSEEKLATGCCAAAIALKSTQKRVTRVALAFNVFVLQVQLFRQEERLIQSKNCSVY
jgi:hypothetical protein